MPTEALIALATAAVSAIAAGIGSAFWEASRGRLARWNAAGEGTEKRPGVVVDVEYDDGTRSAIKLDPEDEQSIDRFIELLQKDAGQKGARREPTAVG